jgi:hypothetical protein
MRCGDVFEDADVHSLDELRAAVVRDDDEGKGGVCGTEGD